MATCIASPSFIVVVTLKYLMRCHDWSVCSSADHMSHPSTAASDIWNSALQEIAAGKLTVGDLVLFLALMAQLYG